MWSRQTRLLGAVSILALCATPGIAQQDGGTVDLGELVLTGELQNRALMEATTSAAIVTGQEISRRSEQDVYDVIERTPGISAAYGEKGFSIRGIDQRGSAGVGMTVRTVVDGLGLPTNQATFFGPYSAWDVAQVEALRGPQSTQ